MKIGILGTGVVGRVLAKAWRERGHHVMMGTRDTAKPESVAAAAEAGVTLGTFADAAALGEALLLATKWDGDATHAAVQAAGAANCAGKLLMDAVNPIRFTATGLDLTVGTTDSAGEQIQRWLPEARVVKAFNMIGSGKMVDPQFAQGSPDMYICGNDDAAKASAALLIRELGWQNVIDMGGISASRMLEPLAQLWIVHGMRTGTWAHAFKLLTQ
jgi:8-hydroxy-5-deazaflavin:NADPH oxidoreductase